MDTGERTLPGMMPDEVLAVCRLRQWPADRAAMRAGQVTNYHREGWRERRTRDGNARIVRVIDFERASVKDLRRVGVSGWASQ